MVFLSSSLLTSFDFFTACSTGLFNVSAVFCFLVLPLSSSFGIFTVFIIVLSAVSSVFSFLLSSCVFSTDFIIVLSNLSAVFCFLPLSLSGKDGFITDCIIVLTAVLSKYSFLLSFFGSSTALIVLSAISSTFSALSID